VIKSSRQFAAHGVSVGFGPACITPINDDSSAPIVGIGLGVRDLVIELCCALPLPGAPDSVAADDLS
jgi:hypothetical protein